jgi:glycosyltransferase involved in cell wall biosynthesis
MERYKNSSNKIKILYIISVSGLNSPSTVVRAEIYKNSFHNDNIYSADYYYLFSKTLDKIIFLLKKKKYTKYFSAPFIFFNYFIKILKKFWLFIKLDNYSAIIIIKYFDKNYLKKIKLNYSGKILFDFDDAIWTKEFGGDQPFIDILTIVDYVSCDNTYLLEESNKFCNNCFILNGPTKLNIFESYKFIKKENLNKIVIGWIGSPYTLFYLTEIVDVLDQLSQVYTGLEFRICGVGTDLTKIPKFKNTKLSILPFYNQDTMIDEISNFDIGVYPLDNSVISLGRGSLKATLYMSCAIPVVATALGNNCNIISNGQTGYLVNSKKEWFDVISNLITNSELRNTIGQNGYEYVKKEYSIDFCYNQLKNNFLKNLNV